MIMEYNILVIFENSNGLHSLKSTKEYVTYLIQASMKKMFSWFFKTISLVV
jgi:hypothetical protein